MLQSQVRAGSWMLEQDKVLLASHTVDRPFATAVKREKSYQENRGTYKETVRETARIPLTKVKREGEEIVFSDEGHSLRVKAESRPRGVELLLHPGAVYEEEDIRELTNRDDLRFLTSPARKVEAEALRRLGKKEEAHV